MKLAILTNILTPYRIPFFEELERNVEGLTVFLMAASEENRDWNLAAVGFECHVLPGWDVRPPGWEVSAHLNYGVRSALESVRPDVVLSGGFAPANVAAFAYCKARARSYVQWGELSRVDMGFRRGPRNWIRRLLCGHADAAVASSSAARRAFEHFGCASDRILTNVMPIEIERIHRAVVEWRTSAVEAVARADDARPLILSVGRITHYKGYEELLSIYERVLSQVPDARLLIVGDGPDRAKCEAIAQGKSWKGVRFEGFVQPEDLPRYLAVADVFVFPTLSDTFGAVLAEAMAAEAVSLSSIHAAATEDLVDDGVNGFVFDPRDSGRGAELVTKVLRMHPTERWSMGRAAYEKVRRFDVAPSAVELALFLRRVAAEPRSGTATGSHGGPGRNLGRNALSSFFLKSL